MLADNSDKFNKFEDIYGTSTSEKDRPSLQATGDKAADKPVKHLLNASRVRDVVACGEYLKPHCIYSAVKLSSTKIDAVNQAKEVNFHTCGSELFPSDHTLSHSVVVGLRRAQGWFLSACTTGVECEMSDTTFLSVAAQPQSLFFVGNEVRDIVTRYSEQLRDEDEPLE